MPRQTSIARSLPALLLSRPNRQVLENEKERTIRIDQVQGLKPPYFVTACNDCDLDFRRLPGLAQITIERCHKSRIVLCPVIASIDIINSDKLDVEIVQSQGTICVDMSTNITLTLREAPSGITVFASSSDLVVLKSVSGEDYTVTMTNRVQADHEPGRERYKTWYEAGFWHTALCNLYGDVLEDGNIAAPSA